MLELRYIIRMYVLNKFNEKAIEHGLKGEVVPTGNYFDIKNKEVVTRYNKNCLVLYVNPEPDLADIIKREFSNIKYANLSMYRSGEAECLNKVPTDIVTMSKKDLIEHIKSQYTAQYARKVLISLDEDTRREYLDEFSQKGKQFMSCLDQYQLFNDEDREPELVNLLYALMYDNDDIGKVVRYYHQDHKEDFPKSLLDKGVFHDNRLYLPWDDEMCLVLSKNPYDYIWASTGNGYQSCFCLESEYWGIQAMPMLATQPWHFMMYWSKCKLNEYSIMNHKFKLPNIKARMWAYRSGDGLVTDKMYGRELDVDFTRQVLELLYPEFSTKECEIEIDDDEFTDIIKRYRTYLDSLNYQGHYRFADGAREFTRDAPTDNEIKETVSNAFYNPDLKWKAGKLRLLNGKPCYVNVCPKTQLPTEGSEHWAAKYIDRPVRSMAIFGYQADLQSNGLSLIEASNRSVNAEHSYWYGDDYIYQGSGPENLNTLKDALAECQTKHPQVDCILLRIVDKNKVTFQPFYAKKEPEFK